MMKRSEIDASIDRAIAFFREARFPLPAWAFWGPDEWAQAGPDYDEVRRVRLGWDVTDFGSGDLAAIGRTIFTLRNGLHDDPDYPKSYAEKVMCLAPGQKSVIHCHRSKREDIICRGGPGVRITVWAAAGEEGGLSGDGFTVSVDGCATPVEAGQTLTLAPGQSVCLPPWTYHQFWGAEEGDAPTLSVEVSSICNDLTDNVFLEGGERFPTIDEDEPRRWVLCSEYDRL
jgi:hypothetical protein